MEHEDHYCPVAKTGNDLLAQLLSLAHTHPDLMRQPIQVHRPIEAVHDVPDAPDWTPVQLRIAYGLNQLVIE